MAHGFDRNQIHRNSECFKRVVLAKAPPACTKRIWDFWDIKRHSTGSWPRNLLDALFKNGQGEWCKGENPREWSQELERTIDWTELKLSQGTFPIPRVQDSGNICSLGSQNCCRLITSICLLFFPFRVRGVYWVILPFSTITCWVHGMGGVQTIYLALQIHRHCIWTWLSLMPCKNGTMGMFWRGISCFSHGEMEWMDICDQKEAGVVAAIKTPHSNLLIMGRVNVMLDYMQMTMKWQVVCLKWVDDLGVTSVPVRGAQGYWGSSSFTYVSLNSI